MFRPGIDSPPMVQSLNNQPNSTVDGELSSILFNC
ncbi:hypothetical protein I656_03699 [Geobacillus sp. WSUCF1]|nr:hypothetical protein I656_03699 [Geobacillus sp. WSUCF1]